MLRVTFRNVMVLLRQGVVTTPLNPKVRSPPFFVTRFISYYGTHSPHPQPERVQCRGNKTLTYKGIN